MKALLHPRVVRCGTIRLTCMLNAVTLWAMQDPVSRNRYYGGYPGHPQTFYDAMSLNSNVLPYAAGVCGGQVS